MSGKPDGKGLIVGKGLDRNRFLAPSRCSRMFVPKVGKGHGVKKTKAVNCGQL